MFAARRIQEIEEHLEELAQHHEWLESVMTKRLIVHTTGNQTIQGSLVAQYDDGIVLRAAELLGSGTPPLPMAGEVFVPREQVFFCQLDR